MRSLKTPLTIRSDSLYCPLSLSLDTYGNCETNCHHCFFRRLNVLWKNEDLRPLDPELLRSKLTFGLGNKDPRTPLANALKRKKTIKLGNKTDPFQPAEKKYRATRKSMEILVELGWSFVLQTRNTRLLMDYEDLLLKADVTVMPVISPGLEKDWELFEKEQTTNPFDRLTDVAALQSKGVKIGINGEPFIPGFHTLEDFERMMIHLKAFKIESYNTYNFHFNPFVARRIVDLPGVDIEKIGEKNVDHYWKSILHELIWISKKYGIDLGCPDFVNSGRNYTERANTCCGITVSNPTTFNTITWKKLLLKGKDPNEILNETWDGVGNFQLGRSVMFSTIMDKKVYTMSDAGFLFKDPNLKGLLA